MGLAGQRIVVLGGTSGIGFQVGRLAADRGAAVVLASSTPAKVDAAVARIPGAEGRRVDLGDEASVERFFADLGAFDHLAFTAGGALLTEPLGALSLDRAMGFFGLRFWGAFAAVKHAVPHIRTGGSIVLSSGMAARRPQANWTVVAAACGAMEALTRALAVELAPLRVNAVCPGLVRTELWDGMPEAARSAMYARAEQRLPVGRAGEPDEVAQAYLYLMRNGFSTGQVVVADGGASVG